MTFIHESHMTNLWPRSHSPLGGAGVSVAGPAWLGPVIAAVFVVDGAGGVVFWRLDTADRADLHPRLSTWLTAVLPLFCHPTVQHRDKRGNRSFKDFREVLKRKTYSNTIKRVLHWWRAGLGVAVSNISYWLLVGLVAEALVDHLTVHYSSAAI